MSEYLPVKEDGDRLAMTAGAAITGGQVVSVTSTGTVVPTAGATDAWLGVAGYDAGVNDLVTVFCEGVQECTASAAITAGTTVTTAASGQVAPFGGGTNYAQVLGIALTNAAGAGNKVRFTLR